MANEQGDAEGADRARTGMIRRLDPLDRVRELGDASVPFHCDGHALVFSDDAVGLETRLHSETTRRQQAASTGTITHFSS